jgi:RNA recognition motif-containing protein
MDMAFPRERKNDSHITFCKFFSEGNCIYGNTCRYPHVGAGEEKSQRPTLPTSAGSGSTQPITLVVENVPPGTKEADLLHLFSSYGSTKDVRFIDKVSESGFGKAHVDMIGKEAVQHAMTELNQWDNPNQLQVSIKGSSSGGPLRNSSSSLMKVGGYSPQERPRYAVPTQSQPDLSLYKTVPCKYYAQGSCSYGLSCTFYHSGTDMPSAAVAYPAVASYNNYQTAQPYQYNPYPPSASYPMPTMDNRDVNRDSRYAANAAKYKTVPCVLFASGKCTFGDKCNFIHAGATETTTTATTATTAK